MPQSVTATTDFQKLYVTCESFSNRDYVALVPGAKWREAHGHWELNLTWASCKQLRALFGDDLSLDETVIKWATQELNNRITPCMATRDLLNPGVPYPGIFDKKMYPYQVAGAMFLAMAGKAILSDPPGAGKTCTAVSAAKSLNVLPALVIAPKSTLVSWGREVEMWWPGANIVIINGTKKQRELQFTEVYDIIGKCPIHGTEENRCASLSATPNSSITQRDSVDPAMSEIYEERIQNSQNANEPTISNGWNETQSELIIPSVIDPLAAPKGTSDTLVTNIRSDGLDSLGMNITNTLKIERGSANSAENQRRALTTIIPVAQEENHVESVSEVFSAHNVMQASTEPSEISNGLTGPKCICPFVIINWELLYRHSRLAPYGSMRLSEEHRTPKELNHVPFRLVIADEAHRMANPQSIQTRAVWHLGDSPTVEYRWALTGTPLTNQIDTLWPVLRYINKEEWPSRVAYIDRYALTRIVPWGSGTEVIGLNPANEEEFQEIFQPRFRRMPKEVILPQLPPIQRTRRYLEMSEVQRRCYEEMMEDMVAETESGELLIAANPAVKMLRMVQFSSAAVDMVERAALDAPSIADQEEPSDIRALTDEELIGTGEFHARLVDPSNKLDALMDDLPDLIEAEESVVVFAVSRQLIEMAEKRLKDKKIKYAVIKGNQKASFRQQQIDDFQNKKVSIILVVIAAGGVGITLTTGRIAIFLQRSWSFIDNHQAEGRLHRIGSEIHDAIEIIDYVSRGTADEVVVQVAEGKEISLEQIVRDREAVQKLMRGVIDDN